MNFVEAIEAMQEGKICRRRGSSYIYKISENELCRKIEKQSCWYCDDFQLDLDDFLSNDWEITREKYIHSVSVGDILLDDEKDDLMIVLDIDEDGFTVIKETGCVEFVGDEELEDDCFKKIGFYALANDAIEILDVYRKEMKK